MPSTTRFERNQVVLVNVPFTQPTLGIKKRPAVILSTTIFHGGTSKLIVAAITSNLSPPQRPGDTILKDWSAAGLLKPSAVRGVLTTVDQADVMRVLGKLSDADMTAVDNSISAVLGFNVS